MPRGSLEVLLVNAKGLQNVDYLRNMDPYVILNCRSQDQKSSVAASQGSNPEWNETFVFSVHEEASELKLTIMDSDVGTAHDFVGSVTIPLDAVFSEGSIPPTSYNVVKDGHYCGSIEVGLLFVAEEQHCCGGQGESYGGWKESSY